MTVAHGLRQLSVGRHGGETVLRLRYSESMGTALQPTIDALQFDRVDTLARLFEMNLTESTRTSPLPKQAGIHIIYSV